MGGCKCAYPECKRISDSKTHFYHFPTKDPARFGVWIANTERTDLLNLAPTQIRNKVICEHHFSENMFMNYKRERLVHNAVPMKRSEYQALKTNSALPIPVQASLVLSTPEASVNNLITEFTPIEIDSSMPMMKTAISPINKTAIINPIGRKNVEESPFVIQVPPNMDISSTPMFISKTPTTVNTSTGTSKKGTKRTITKKRITLAKPMKGDKTVSELALELIQNIAKQNKEKKPDELLQQMKVIELIHNVEPAPLPPPPTTTITENLVTELKELIDEGNKMIQELKEVTEDRQFKDRTIKPVSKALLYAQLVPYLSAELAREVHKELFPSLNICHRK